MSKQLQRHTVKTDITYVAALLDIKHFKTDCDKRLQVYLMKLKYFILKLILYKCHVDVTIKHG